MKLSYAVVMLAVAVAGCTTQPTASTPPQTRVQREAQIEVAVQAVRVGSFDRAEKLLAPYLFRDKDGELLLRSLDMSSETEKKEIDTVALMLWNTGRDATLKSFAQRYLAGYERDVMLCRLAERSANYEKAYSCWNELGDVDRARRTVRTESALRILRD